jgi:hypothetical protein
MKLRQITKRIFTAALAVWMSGIVLVICCQMPSAKAAGAEMESCPLAKKGDCAKSAQVNSGESFGNESQSFDCCVFPAKVFDKARKIEVQPLIAEAGETTEIAAPKSFIVRQTFTSPKIHQSFIRNRGSTYLRNRVFRI